MVVASDQHLADQLDRVVVGGQDAIVGRCAGYFLNLKLSDHTLPLAIRDFYLDYHLFKNYSVISMMATDILGVDVTKFHFS